MGQVDKVLTALRAELAAEEAALKAWQTVVGALDYACDTIGETGLPVDLQSTDDGALVLRVQRFLAPPDLIETDGIFAAGRTFAELCADLDVAVQAAPDLAPNVFEPSPAPQVVPVALVEPAAGGDEAIPGGAVEGLAEPLTPDDQLLVDLAKRFVPPPQPEPEIVPEPEPAAVVAAVVAAVIADAPQPGFPPEAGHFALWTPAEDARVVDLSLTTSARGIAALTGRTHKSIENRLWKLRTAKLPMPAGWAVGPDQKFLRAADAAAVPATAATGTLPPAADGGLDAWVAARLPAVQPDLTAAPPADTPVGADWDHDPRGVQVAPPAGPIADAVPDFAPGLDADRFAAAPQDDLTAHLLGLPRDAVWTWDRDSELAELMGLGWSWAQIAGDMGIRDRDILARFDLMTGFNRETRVRRFIRSQIIDRMAVLSGLAAAGEAA